MIPAPEAPVPATLSRRIMAFALDYLLIAGYLIILTGISAGLTYFLDVSGRVKAWLADPLAADGLTFLTVVLPVMLYFACAEGSAAQATPGKRRAGIRVVDVTGLRLSRPRALVRSFFKFLPWQLAHTSIYHIPGWPLAPREMTAFSITGLILVWVLLAAYALTAALSPSRRTLYDRLAGALVVAGPPARR